MQNSAHTYNFNLKLSIALKLQEGYFLHLQITCPALVNFISQYPRKQDAERLEIQITQ